MKSNYWSHPESERCEWNAFDSFVAMGQEWHKMEKDWERLQEKKKQWEKENKELADKNRNCYNCPEEYSGGWDFTAWPKGREKINDEIS